MATSLVYLRCNSGHYFQGYACPFDGWIFGHAHEIVSAVRRIRDSGRPLSIDQLRSDGVPTRALERVVIMEFGRDESSFAALDPAGFLVNGEYVDTRSAPSALK